MKSFGVHAFLAIALLVPSLHAQNVPTEFPESPKEALSRLAGVLEAVGARFTDDKEARSTLRAIDIDVKWLTNASPRWPMNENAVGFSRSITFTTALLRGLIDGIRKDVQPVLEIARRDIHINALQCRKHGGPASVDVRVATRTRENQEVGGYEVWYVRKAFENVATAGRRFDRNSSPTDQIFREAGFYVFWVEQQAPDGLKRRGARLDVEVGVDVRKQIDLPTP